MIGIKSWKKWQSTGQMYKGFKFLFLFSSVLWVFGTKAQGEPMQSEDAIQKVFEVLSGKQNNIAEDVSTKLKSEPWESLAYLDFSKDSLTLGDLREAVPDYYYFDGDRLNLKLRDPNDYNAFGVEIEVKYVIEGSQIKVYELESGILKDEWEILYLDAYYLALAMDYIRVFFTHTKLK